MLNGNIGTARSLNKVIIRLTFERWFHISENHLELTGAAFEALETVNNPDIIVGGYAGEMLAVKKINKKYLVSIYKETTKKDGFVITAFYTTDIKSLLKNRKTIWQKSVKKK